MLKRKVHIVHIVSEGVKTDGGAYWVLNCPVTECKVLLFWCPASLTGLVSHSCTSVRAGVELTLDTCRNEIRNEQCCKREWNTWCRVRARVEHVVPGESGSGTRGAG